MVTKYKQTDTLPIILTLLFGILCIFFLLIYISIGDGNGIFNIKETIMLTLFLFSFIMTIISGCICDDDSQSHGGKS